MNTETLHVECGDSRALLAELPDASVDSVVCDPPYFLNFMGRDWDKLDGNAAACPDFWRDVLRVLKPGGHLLAFGAPRTYHRLAVAVEDAGFEIRDSIHWCFGTGFPKSLNVGKAIDKVRDDKAEIYEVTTWIRYARDAAGLSNRDIDEAFACNGMGRHWTDVPPGGNQPTVPKPEQIAQLLRLLGDPEVPDRIAGLFATLNGRKGQPGDDWFRREIVGTRTTGIGTGGGAVPVIGDGNRDITAPATDAAKQWDGWGTALKPAHEPIILARKPLTGTVAQNVTEHGTGAINVDACRVGTADTRRANSSATGGFVGKFHVGQENGSPSGRWPPNLLLTHSSDCTETECADGCPVAEMGRQSGTRKSAGNKKPTTGQGAMFGSTGKRAWDVSEVSKGDTGTAARYFPCFRYQAKAPRKERWAHLSCDCGRTRSWVPGDRKQSEATAVTLPKPATCGVDSTGGHGCNTSCSGNGRTAGGSPTGTKSTTSTETNSTTGSRTSSASQFATTSASTEVANCGTEYGSSHANSAGGCSRSTGNTSIFQKKDGPSTGVAVPVTSPLSAVAKSCVGCGTDVARVVHPTQKPIELMRWLCRLVTPPGGLVLDPFTGSGSTGCAAAIEGFRFLGFELDEGHAETARARIEHHRKATEQCPDQD